MIGALIAFAIRVGWLRQWVLFLATFPLMFLAYLSRDLLVVWQSPKGDATWDVSLFFDWERVYRFGFVVAGLLALGWFLNWQLSKKAASER